MAYNITNQLQEHIAEVAESMMLIEEESKDIGKVYWSTDANTVIGALGASDAATLATTLTKTEYLSGVTLAEELEDFFFNEAVSTSDYIQNCEKIKYGSAATGVNRGNATEALGSRIYQVALDCIELYKSCRHILRLYSQNEVGDMIANLDTHRIIPGSEMTRDELNSGITLVEQFKKMMNNEAVTQGDYSATLAKWHRFQAN